MNRILQSDRAGLHQLTRGKFFQHPTPLAFQTKVNQSGLTYYSNTGGIFNCSSSTWVALEGNASVSETRMRLIGGRKVICAKPPPPMGSTSLVSSFAQFGNVIEDGGELLTIKFLLLLA